MCAFFIYFIKIYSIIRSNFDCGKIAGTAGRDGTGIEIFQNLGLYYKL
jgi:hypothetical protein